MKNIFSTLVFLLTICSVVHSQNVRIDPALLEQFESHRQVDYIVLMKDRIKFGHTLSLPTKQAKAEFVYRQLLEKSTSSQKEIQLFLKSKQVFYQSFYVTNALRVTSDIDVMFLLAQRHDVETMMYDQPIKMLDFGEEKEVSKTRNVEPEWGIKMIKADSVWAMGYNGQGITIGGQDTGYAWDVSPLKEKYKGFVDSTNINHNYHWHDAIYERNPAYPDSLLNPCGFKSIVPCDDHNHGTHTMGTMVGEDDENKIGVAPGARWIGCRNMDRGWGKPSTYLECFEWFLAPYDLDGNGADPSKSPHVINNSWYCSIEEGCNLENFYLMNDVVNNLKSSGIVVVVSAGNSGPGCGSLSGPPAIFEHSFTIGATTDVDSIARYSARGLVTIDSSFRMKPNVTAPGSRVRSVIRNGDFANFSGTSMAGPHVAGLVALILSANPALAGEVEVIESIIESTSVNKTFDQDCNGISGYDIPNTVYGYGRVDALSAVQKAIGFVNTQHIGIEKLGVQVYPNPTDDQITFELKNENETFVWVQIVDIHGRVVLKNLANKGQKTLQWSCQYLPGGVYQYNILSQSGNQYTGRIVKW